MTNKPADPLSDQPTRFAFSQSVGWILVALMVVIGTLAQKYVENIMDGHEFALPAVAKDAARDSLIVETLYNLMHKTGAARAYVFVLHNGGFVAGRIPFKKTSCVAEVVRPGVSREIANCANIPLSSVPELVDALVTNDGLVEWTIADMKDTTFKASLEAQQIAYLKIHRVMIGNELWGFVGIDYLTKPVNTTDSNECVDLAAHMIQLELERTR